MNWQKIENCDDANFEKYRRIILHANAITWVIHREMRSYQYRKREYKKVF